MRKTCDTPGCKTESAYMGLGKCRKHFTEKFGMSIKKYYVLYAIPPEPVVKEPLTTPLMDMLSKFKDGLIYILRGERYLDKYDSIKTQILIEQEYAAFLEREGIEPGITSVREAVRANEKR